MKQLKILLTDDQLKAFLELCEAQGKTQADAVRDLIKQACSERGIEFEEAPQWGGKRK
jgi:hypothetical protein